MIYIFTGIIEEIGRIERINRGSLSASIRVVADAVLEGTKIGDSICVNGVCLTVTGLDGKSFTADVMEETMRRSGLKDLKINSAVNLERAMPADGRFGGHIVSGHIDGTGTIASIKKEEMAVWYEVKTDSSLLRYIVEKGSIAIDGISLTVARVTGESFAVSIIPHTISETTLSDKSIGDTVNLETDIIGKYVEKMISSDDKNISQLQDYDRGVEFLKNNGFS